MINWKFIEEHMEDSAFKFTTIEQADEFLKACEEHGITWTSGDKSTEWRNWEGTIANSGHVFFQIRFRALSYGAIPGGSSKHRYEYSDIIAPMKDVFIGALERMLGIYKEFHKIEFAGLCEGTTCNECAMYSNSEACGYHCRWNQLDELIKEIKRIAEEHTWPDEKPTVKELTVNEISKLLGYEVKVVKED